MERNLWMKTTINSKYNYKNILLICRLYPTFWWNTFGARIERISCIPHWSWCELFWRDWRIVAYLCDHRTYTSVDVSALFFFLSQLCNWKTVIECHTKLITTHHTSYPECNQLNKSLWMFFFFGKFVSIFLIKIRI